MAEYIEREALKEHLKSYTGMFTDEIGFAVSLEAVLRGIDFQPAADVAPVWHGRWIPIRVPTGAELLGIKETVVGFIRCSKCNMEFDISCEWYSKYCPHCGADMRGE